MLMDAGNYRTMAVEKNGSGRYNIVRTYGYKRQA